jgi:hypothetical protein
MFWSTDWRKLVTTTVWSVVGLVAFPVFSFLAFLSLSDAGAGVDVVVEVEAGADVCAKATAGIPRQPPNDKVAKASAAYNGLRVNAWGR